MNMEERPSQVIEEYLLVLYKLQRDGEKAKSVTLANSLDTSAPTVHATVGRMQRDGLIKVNRSKEIQLTQLGFEMAENITYRHNLAEDFLCNTLGILWFEVHKHAHQLEHAMTPLVVENSQNFLVNLSSVPMELRCRDNHFLKTALPWIRPKPEAVSRSQ